LAAIIILQPESVCSVLEVIIEYVAGHKASSSSSSTSNPVPITTTSSSSSNEQNCLGTGAGSTLSAPLHNQPQQQQRRQQQSASHRESMLLAALISNIVAAADTLVQWLPVRLPTDSAADAPDAAALKAAAEGRELYDASAPLAALLLCCLRCSISDSNSSHRNSVNVLLLATKVAQVAQAVADQIWTAKQSPAGTASRAQRLVITSSMQHGEDKSDDAAAAAAGGAAAVNPRGLSGDQQVACSATKAATAAAVEAAGSDIRPWLVLVAECLKVSASQLQGNQVRQQAEGPDIDAAAADGVGVGVGGNSGRTAAGGSSNAVAIAAAAATSVQSPCQVLATWMTCLLQLARWGYDVDLTKSGTDMTTLAGATPAAPCPQRAGEILTSSAGVKGGTSSSSPQLLAAATALTVQNSLQQQQQQLLLQGSPATIELLGLAYTGLFKAQQLLLLLQGLLAQNGSGGLVAVEAARQLLPLLRQAVGEQTAVALELAACQVALDCAEVGRDLW
jgi:hypothetical protein